MSTTVQNPGLDILETTPASVADVVPNQDRSRIPSHEALQALLAFSALHEQIRQRREHNSKGVSANAWEVDEFVLDEVLQLVAERALSITGADGVAIALANEDAIVCRAVAGTTTPDRGVRLQPNSGFSGACLISGTIVRCDDSETDLRVSPIICRELGVRSMVAVPLSAKQHVIGLLEAFSSEAFGFNDSDVRNLSLLAELILAALKPEEEDRLAEIAEQVVHPEKLPAAVAQPEVEQPEPLAAKENEDQEELPVLSQTLANPPRRSARPGLTVVLTLITFALVLGAGLWWGIRSHTNAQRSTSTLVAVSRATESALPAQTLQTTNNGAAAPAESSSAGQEPVEDEGAVTEAAKAGRLASVTGIRHWSSADSSVVVIDLEDQVQYEAHRLPNPDRIYFDLHDTRLAPNLSARNIEIGDDLLGRVRVAQLTPGITRVVLETKGSSNFSISLEPNPYRLVVELRKIGAKPQSRTKVDLFGPMSPAPTVAQNGDSKLSPVAASKPVIVLDAGHGGWDLGTVGRKGLLEKDLVLDIVARLGKLVQNRLSANVIYTRKDDSYVTLEKRAELANVAQANLFVSIHANYSDYPSARGVETYFTNTYSSIKARAEEDRSEPSLQNVNWTDIDIRKKVRESRRLASSIQHSLYETLAAKNPGLPNRGVKEAQYVVLTGTSMPAVLAEISFVSSPTDENNLQSSSYRQRIAEALFQGIAHYEAESNRLAMASAPTKQVR